MASFLLSNRSALEGNNGVDYGGDSDDGGDGGVGGDDGGDDGDDGGGDVGGWDWDHPVKTQAGNGVTLCGD